MLQREMSIHKDKEEGHVLLFVAERVCGTEIFAERPINKQ